MTEKGSRGMDQGAYIFDITASASKNEVRKAIFALYKVHPARVNILKVPDKKVKMRGKIGIKHGGKKAVVYLKEGDKIEFI